MGRPLRRASLIAMAAILSLGLTACGTTDYTSSDGPGLDTTSHQAPAASRANAARGCSYDMPVPHIVEPGTVSFTITGNVGCADIGKLHFRVLYAENINSPLRVASEEIKPDDMGAFRAFTYIMAAPTDPGSPTYESRRVEATTPVLYIVSSTDIGNQILTRLTYNRNGFSALPDDTAKEAELKVTVPGVTFVPARS